MVKARPRPVLTPYPIEKFPSMEANPTVRVLALNKIKMEGPFLSCTSTYSQLIPTSYQIQLFKELAEQPISLIRELLQMRLMVKALQLIQLNGPGPR